MALQDPSAPGTATIARLPGDNIDATAPDCDHYDVDPSLLAADPSDLGRATQVSRAESAK